MGFGQTEQTEKVCRPNQAVQKFGYLADRTDQNLSIDKTEQTEIWLSARPIRPKMGIMHTEQTELRVLARPTTPKYGFWADKTDRNMGIDQTDQTKIWFLARVNGWEYG